jgi:hypothetical protein
MGGWGGGGFKHVNHRKHKGKNTFTNALLLSCDSAPPPLLLLTSIDECLLAIIVSRRTEKEREGA